MTIHALQSCDGVEQTDARGDWRQVPRVRRTENRHLFYNISDESPSVRPCIRASVRRVELARSEPVLWLRRKKDGQTRHTRAKKNKSRARIFFDTTANITIDRGLLLTLSNYFANTLLTLRVEIV